MRSLLIYWGPATPVYVTFQINVKDEIRKARVAALNAKRWSIL